MSAPKDKAEAWHEIEPHLDRAFELDDAERESYLCELGHTEPRIAQAIRELIAERARLDAEGFLADSVLPSDRDESLAGVRVGAYTIERLIGRGGMGEVWLAARSDGRFEGQCALKFLDASIASTKVAERFRREGHLLGRLNHPHIARLLDAGATADGRAYLALEYVDGEPIDEYCASLSIEQRVRLYTDVVAAVAHAHTHLIIHRDIKPSNVLVTREGQVKLLDFGIAKLVSADRTDPGVAMTRMEEAVLTPKYAAPEQLLGEMPSTATDVYQLGMLLFELLTGQHPLPQGQSRAERARAAVDTVLPRASDMVEGAARRTLQGDLDSILAKALRGVPEERYATAQAFREDLLRYLQHEPVQARSGASWYRVRKFVVRHRYSVATSAIAVTAICAALLFAIERAHEAVSQRDAARKELARATATNDFATFLLSVAAPGSTKFTVAELLAESERLIEKQFAGDSPVKAELLATVGKQYMQSGYWTEASALLECASQIAHRSGDAALIARADCPFGFIEAMKPDLEQGEALIVRALERLNDRSEHTHVKAECLVRLSDLGYLSGDGVAMIRHSSEALRLIESLQGESLVRRSEAQGNLAYGYYLVRDSRKADEMFAQAMATLEAAGRERTLEAASLFNNWALVHFQGDIRKAEPLLHRALELRRQIEGAEGVEPTVMHNYAGLLLKLGRLPDALPIFEETIRGAAARQEHALMFDAMMELAELHILGGDLQKAAAQLDKLVPYHTHANFTRGRRAQLAYYEAHLAEKQGDCGAARDRYADSVKRFQELLQKIALTVDAWAGLARCESALRNSAAAMEAAQQALSLAQSMAAPGAKSHLVGIGMLAVADQLRLKGSTETSAMYKTALEHLDSTLGPEHPLTREAREKASSLELADAA